ncbi:uncharacterized protein LOC131605754 [Vicia villosa]|uniref:uncharacterized protein LOC131605754 n=1 Tax=Vicia villosa TaxID=3911 RepID=UPI00273C86E6|nr:uncharacterized protein LOC131605754 [Vicia villosa]
MSTRKFESGSSKLRKKKRIDALVESQKGALDKFIKTNKKSSSNEQVNNVETNNIDIDNENENIDYFVEEVNNIDNEENANSNLLTEGLHSVEATKNIYDPSQWINISTSLRDLLVEKDPIKVTDINFSKDESTRHFSSSFYIQKLLNGEKRERIWLIYSQDLNKVFCFCCKLLNTLSSTSKLTSDGICDWKNMGNTLKSHEMSKEHIVNMDSWIDLEMRLLKNKTIDIHVQDQINRDREHWRNVMVRDALLKLSEMTDEPKIKSEADCLATYELENFEFLLGMTIWYEILFAVNSISQNMQSNDMCIVVAIEQLKGLVSFFEKYRENGFENALISAKEIAIEMNIEPKFHKKRIIRRKKHFDEIIDNETCS